MASGFKTTLRYGKISNLKVPLGNHMSIGEGGGRDKERQKKLGRTYATNR